MNRSRQILTSIAREHLGIATLEARHSDSLDFHDVAVWGVKDALMAAFDAGLKAAGQNPQAHAVQQTPPALVVPATPLLVPNGATLIPDKLYLRLYHGRTDPSQEMDGWGFAGPTFGPLSCYTQTYCCDFWIHVEHDNHALRLHTHDDLIRWDGCYYGDLEVFIAKAGDKA